MYGMGGSQYCLMATDSATALYSAGEIPFHVWNSMVYIYSTPVPDSAGDLHSAATLGWQIPALLRAPFCVDQSPAVCFAGRCWTSTCGWQRLPRTTRAGTLPCPPQRMPSAEPSSLSTRPASPARRFTTSRYDRLPVICSARAPLSPVFFVRVCFFPERNVYTGCRSLLAHAPPPPVCCLFCLPVFFFCRREVCGDC